MYINNYVYFPLHVQKGAFVRIHVSKYMIVSIHFGVNFFYYVCKYTMFWCHLVYRGTYLWNCWDMIQKKSIFMGSFTFLIIRKGVCVYNMSVLDVNIEELLLTIYIYSLSLLSLSLSHTHTSIYVCVCCF